MKKTIIAKHEINCGDEYCYPCEHNQITKDREHCCFPFDVILEKELTHKPHGIISYSFLRCKQCIEAEV